MHYLLIYDVVEGYAEKRAPFRQGHLLLARAAVKRGELVLAGAWADPLDGAALLFSTPDRAVVESFAKNDPYVQNGLVTSWKVKPWTTVVGCDAAGLLPDEALPASGPLTRPGLVAFLGGVRHWVVASVAQDGSPQCAVVGVAVSDALELVFDTLDSTRKAANLRRHARAALTFARGAATAQIEGAVDEPSGEELERLKAVYFATFPDGRERAAWPGITYFRVKPTWLKTSDFGAAEPRVMELGHDELRALLR